MINGFLKEKIRMINHGKELFARGRSSRRESIKINSRINKKRGFILLFSLLISSIMLTAGLAISRIIIRQIYLASVQRDSQMALFAADTGLECARYWKENGPNTPPECNEQVLKDYDQAGVPLLGAGSVGSSDVKFFFNLGSPSIQKTCVQVEVKNSASPQKIKAKGYNVECDISTGKPIGGRVVERELSYIYSQ
ncbi:MAG TPA: pilus assembly PilX N-terminal domain-containing protein [Candidatus Paceibacterota bacterium]|nr:pilus assembly PilX N-terminal domain-containing protein [Candidatus Paceibacterota bacterium]